MIDHSLLASLAGKFRDKPENIAIASLEHIVKRSTVSRDVLTTQAFAGVLNHDPVTLYRSQSQEERTRPDIAGINGAGSEIVLIEAKFWAGLTDQQPNGYLNRLIDPGNTALCFVVPEARRPALWHEVVGRVSKDFTVDDVSSDATYRCKVVDGRTLSMVTWQGLLKSMLEVTTTTGDLKTAHDIEQLASLCQYLEQEGFVPLRSEDLGPAVPRLIGQLTMALDQTVESGVTQGKFSTKGYSATGARERFTRYFVTRDVRLDLSVHYHRWISHGLSPVWLRFQGRNTGPEHLEFLANREKFVRYESDIEGTMFFDDDGTPNFALELLTGVDLDNVVSSLIDQIDEIVDLLQPI
ncbi:hypothetical protein GKN94_11390 [Candidatus Lucifugimonas marina]|uniref:hypothetical protein n=1 Tax=Candidatus Lucifugimonas marina TaxID=3038979 RepID=UPI00279AACB5|nr:hypothetical protein GKN94_11390 [SAR202 cluster bacterium JH545]